MRRTRLVKARGSAIHGRGVFAEVDLPEGEEILEYEGRIIPWSEACERDSGDGHTFYFDLGDGNVIDGGTGGGTARWVNHGCNPNCETTQDGQQVFFRTLRPIAAGDELLIDYSLVVEDPDDPEVRELYACRCGDPACRGTMLGDPATA